MAPYDLFHSVVMQPVWTLLCALKNVISKVKWLQKPKIIIKK